MSKILVTTPTGNIGSVVARELKAGNADFVAGLRDVKSDAAKDFARKDIEVVHFDFTDPESMLAAMQGVERLFLLLPLDESMRVWGNNAVKAAKEAGVKHIVRSSGMGADPNAHFRLGKVHGAVDADVEESGMDYTILRPSPFMQNFLNYGPVVRESSILPIPEGEGRTSFIDAADVGRCAAHVLADCTPHAGKTYVLTGPEALSNHEVAAILSAVAGKRVEYVDTDFETYGRALEDMGVPEWTVHMILSVHRYAKGGYTGFMTQGVEHLTGVPARDLESFAAEHAEVWK